MKFLLARGRREWLMMALTGAVACLALPMVARAVSKGAEVDYTASQVVNGKGLYAQNCASCHGAELEGQAGPALSGQRFAVAWLNGQKTAGDLDQKIRKTMPMDKPGGLTDAQFSAIIAYLYQRNGFHSNETPYDIKTMATAMLMPPAGSGAAASDPNAPRPQLPMAPDSVDAASTAKPDDAELVNPDNASWMVYNKQFNAQRYSTLDQINAGNAGKLVPQCIVQLGESGSFQSSPVIYDGVLYVTTAYSTYAVDATSCKKLWTQNYPVDNQPPVKLSRGVAIYKGKLFKVTPNGHLLAIDAKNGKLLWDVWMSDQRHGYWLSAAPIAYDGKVFIGEAGADWGANAHIFAFDAETGQHAWTFDVIPTGKQKGAETWKSGAEHGGGSMWTSMTLDPVRHELYASIGNPAPDFDGALRPGDNLYTDSVVVLDDRTGNLNWYVQQVPHDIHDQDSAAAPVLYEQGGRRYLAVANKGGQLFIYDGATHKLLSVTDVAKRENLDLPITPEGVHACPGTNGGVEWFGPAYSPQTSLLYVNSVDWCSTTSLTENRYVEGASYFNGDFHWDPVETASGNTHAVDAATGKIAWTRHSETPMVAALTPTAGGVVFTGDLNGFFLALDAKTGETLYRFNTGGGIGGGISTYQIGGKQYVAVASGNNSRTIWHTTGAATVVIFGLPGQ